MVQGEVKASEIAEYGPDKLPAGPDVAATKDVILVEGRADVLTLLKSDITNAVAIGGATSNIPKTIIDLAAEKEVTVFADGDRGGDLVIRSLMSHIDIDFVARAPDGKEVEELTRKELIKCLRSKVPIEQYLGTEKSKEQNERRAQRQQYEQRREPQPQQYERREPQQYDRREPQPIVRRPEAAEQNAPITAPPAEQAARPAQRIEMPREARAEAPEVTRSSVQDIGSEPLTKPSPKTAKPVIESAVLAELATSLDQLTGTLRSRLFSNDGSMVKEVPIRELLAELQYASNVYGVVLDGVITQRLIELAQQKGVRAIYGVRANPMPKMPLEMLLYTKEQGKLT